MPRFFLWSLIAIVAVAPLPLGSNRPLAWSLLSLEVGVLLMLWSIHHLWTGQALPVSVKRIRAPLVLFGLACSWVLIQLIPNVPFGLAHPAWQELNTFFGSDVPERITIDPDHTMMFLLRWFVYAGVFWLALQLGRDRAAAKIALGAFVSVAAAYALYGLVALFALGDTLLLYDKWASRGAATSTFVNRNSYATFAGLGVIAATALIMKSRPRHNVPGIFSRERLYDLLSRGFTVSAFGYLSFFLAATVLLLTGSRAGALSTFAAFFVLVWGLSRGVRAKARPNIVGFAIFLTVVVGIVSFSGGFLGDRLARGGDVLRAENFPQALSAIEDHAFVGSGLGSFPQIFPLYRDSGALRDRHIAKLHNTYLESALELGLPAAICLALAIGLLTQQCWRGMSTRSRDGHLPAMGLAASILVGLHAFVDFSLQIPAVVVAYMFLMGIAVAQSFSSRRL
ncbi:MAG: O-antigen ligase family protein [Parvibaculaceae bacterium]|nr:O-antigen ligase family protein [Parvibaculaceae bacterium]